MSARKDVDVSHTGMKRRYRSTLRQEQAEETRHRILDAANRLFLERGYLATTMDEVADAANVAKETIYANVGSKRALLLQLFHGAVAGQSDPGPFVERPEIREILEEPDQRQQICLFARSIRGVMERGGAIFQVLLAASYKEAEIAALIERLQQDRFDNTQIIIEALAARGPLEPSLDVGEASDIAWTLTSPEVYRSLYRRGWTLDRYESWLAKSLAAFLLPIPR